MGEFPPAPCREWSLGTRAAGTAPGAEFDLFAPGGSTSSCETRNGSRRKPINNIRTGVFVAAVAPTHQRQIDSKPQNEKNDHGCEWDGTRRVLGHQENVQDEASAHHNSREQECSLQTG